MLHQQTTLNCRGQLLDLSHPKIMGILNVTPDSFYDGGKYEKEQSILKQAEKMIAEGAAIIDIGGMSSRPGAKLISVEEELSRVLPAVKAIHEAFPEQLISIDTIRAEVAEQCIEHGASIINDISAGQFDDQLFGVAAKYKVPYMLMHMKGRPEDMQVHPDYEDIIVEIIDFLIKKIAQLREVGVIDIVIDPGFGFGKSIQDNYTILKNLHAFKILDLPILAGLSRKSMIYKKLNITADEALNGTSVLNLVALQQGASILRVHDVKAAAEVIDLYGMLV